MRILPKCLALAPLINAVAACALIGGPDLHDLRLVSIEIVDLKDRSDIVWLSNDPRPSQSMIMMSFSTDTDLTAFARRYEYNVSGAASICEGSRFDPSRELQGDPGVYDDDGLVDPNRHVDAKSGSRRVPAIYHVYWNVRPIRLSGRTPPFAYDLQRDPEDVCFELRGGNMLGRRFTSNTVLVDRKVLYDAVLRAHSK